MLRNILRDMHCFRLNQILSSIAIIWHNNTPHRSEMVEKKPRSFFAYQLLIININYRIRTSKQIWAHDPIICSSSWKLHRRLRYPNLATRDADCIREPSTRDSRRSS